MPNLLSVVIPVFNEERTVVSMLDRVAAAQTPGMPLELVIVNDGSAETLMNEAKKLVEWLKGRQNG